MVMAIHDSTMVDLHDHIQQYDRHAATLAPIYDTADRSQVHGIISRSMGGRMTAARALDIGAGSGRDARWLRDNGCTVTAMEPSSAMRRIGMSHPDNRGVLWVDGMLPHLRSVRAESQDLVLINAVWQHVAPGDRVDAFSAALNVLASEGLMFVLTRHGPAPSGRPMFEISEDEIPEHAKRCGLPAPERHRMGDVLGRADVGWNLWTIRRHPKR